MYPDDPLRTSAPASLAMQELTQRGPWARVGTHSARWKRLFDILFSGVGLLCSSPLWLLIALGIKLEDGGPVFYAQSRVGLNGKIFRVLKFRSMVLDAERLTGAVLASVNDGRITRVGRFLRATALDELPQLLSIFLGDMSLVGPRPERPEFVEQFRRGVPGYHRRLLVRPGLTGLAQIYARYDSAPRQKLRYDMLYVRRYSLALDAKLVAVSFWISLRGKWQEPRRKL